MNRPFKIGDLVVIQKRESIFGEEVINWNRVFTGGIGKIVDLKGDNVIQIVFENLMQANKILDKSKYNFDMSEVGFYYINEVVFLRLI